MLWWQVALRLLISGGIVVGASELAKRSEILGAVLISLPTLSILAIIWLYHDTGDTERISEFANEILWLVNPALSFFIALPIALKRGVDFWPALGIACVITMIAYAITITGARRMGLVA